MEEHAFTVPYPTPIRLELEVEPLIIARDGVGPNRLAFNGQIDRIAQLQLRTQRPKVVDLAVESEGLLAGKGRGSVRWPSRYPFGDRFLSSSS